MNTFLSLFTYSDILCCQVFHLNGSNCCCHKTPKCLPTHQIDCFFSWPHWHITAPKMASFVNLPPVWLCTSFLQHGNTHQNVLWSKQQSWFKNWNGILLPKLFWPIVRKKCSSDWEKLLKFEAEGWEFAKCFRSQNNLFKQWKVRAIFGNRMLF